MSKAPKSGYARTPTADGGFEFTYMGSRFAPMVSGLICIIAIAIFVYGAFTTPFGFFLFIAVLAFIICFGLFGNAVPHSFTVYPDRIVTHKGQTVPFDNITHLSWDANKSTRFFGQATVTVQAMGNTVNITGFLRPNVAMGLHNEIKKVSDVRFS